MFLKYFIVEPWKRKSLATAFYRLCMVLHERTNGKFDIFYRKWAALIHPSRELPQPEWLDNNTIDNIVVDLKNDGCRVLPVRLRPEEIKEVSDFAFSTPAYVKDPSEKIAIRANAIPTDFGRYTWPVQPLLQLKTVQRLMQDSTLHRIAQSYLGAQCIVTSIILWITPTFTKEFAANIYHYDNDGPGFLKYFIYITDVEADTGAHRFIKGTHHPVKPDAFKMSKRYDEDTLLNHFGVDKEIMFTAPAGTIIAEDTAGFHRGGTVSRDYRLLMQLQYGLIDSPLDEEFMQKIHPVPLEGLDKRLARMTRKYFYSA